MPISARKSVYASLTDNRVPTPPSIQSNIRPTLNSDNTRRLKILSLITKISLTVAVFLTPLFVLPLPSGIGFAKQTLLMLMVAIALVCWVSEQFVSSSFKIHWTIVHTSVAIFLGAVAVSTYFSNYPYGSMVGTMNVMGSFFTTVSLVFLFFLLSEQPPEDRRYWLWAVVATAGVVSLYAIAQFFGLFLLPWSFAKTSQFVLLESPNMLAIYLALIWPFLLTLYASSYQIYSKAIIVIVGLLSLVVLQFIASTLAWSIVLVGSICWIAGQTISRHHLGAKALVIPTILLVISLFFIVQPQPFVKINLPVEVGLSHKLSYKIAYDTATSGLSKLFFGSGPTTFVHDFSLYRPVELNNAVFVSGGQSTPLWSIRFNQASSMWLGMFATMGVVGVASFLLLVVLAFVSGRRLLLSVSEVDKAMYGGLLAAFALVVIASIFNALSLSTFLLLWVALGLLTMRAEETLKYEISLDQLTHGAIVVVIVFVVAGFSALLGISMQTARVIAEVRSMNGIIKLTDGKIDEAVKQLTLAANRAPKADTYYGLLAQASFSQLQELSRNRNAEPVAVQQALLRTIQSRQMARQLNPKDVSNVAGLATVYQQVAPYFDDAASLAVQTFREAETLEPTNPALPTERARSYLVAADNAERNAPRDESGKASAEAIEKYKQEQLAEASSAISKALELKSDYAPARFLEANISIRHGKTDEAIAKLNELQRQNPTDDSLQYQRGLLFYSQDDFSAAEEAFRNAVKLNQNFANARYFLGLTLDKKGDKAGAIEQFEKIAELDKEAKEVTAILENLRAGRPALENISPPGPTPESRAEEPIDKETNTEAN